MKKGIIILISVFGLFLNSAAQHNKEHIKDLVYDFNGRVTAESLSALLDSLKLNSIDSNKICFISLFMYNDCTQGKDEVFAMLDALFLNELLGKTISVSLKRERKLWDDEDYYIVHFLFTHPENVEHLSLGINEGLIKNISYWKEQL